MAHFYHGLTIFLLMCIDFVYWEAVANPDERQRHPDNSNPFPGPCPSILYKTPLNAYNRNSYSVISHLDYGAAIKS